MAQHADAHANALSFVVAPALGVPESHNEPLIAALKASFDGECRFAKLPRLPSTRSVAFHGRNRLSLPLWLSLRVRMRMRPLEPFVDERGTVLCPLGAATPRPGTSESSRAHGMEQDRRGRSRAHSFLRAAPQTQGRQGASSVGGPGGLRCGPRSRVAAARVVTSVHTRGPLRIAGTAYGEGRARQGFSIMLDT